jgi:hypothetical protein
MGGLFQTVTGKKGGAQDTGIDPAVQAMVPALLQNPQIGPALQAAQVKYGTIFGSNPGQIEPTPNIGNGQTYDASAPYASANSYDRMVLTFRSGSGKLNVTPQVAGQDTQRVGDSVEVVPGTGGWDGKTFEVSDQHGDQKAALNTLRSDIASGVLAWAGGGLASGAFAVGAGGGSAAAGGGSSVMGAGGTTGMAGVPSSGGYLSSLYPGVPGVMPGLSGAGIAATAAPVAGAAIPAAVVKGAETAAGGSAVNAGVNAATPASSAAGPTMANNMGETTNPHSIPGGYNPTDFATTPQGDTGWMDKFLASGKDLGTWLAGDGKGYLSAVTGALGLGGDGTNGGGYANLLGTTAGIGLAGTGIKNGMESMNKLEDLSTTPLDYMSVANANPGPATRDFNEFYGPGTAGAPSLWQQMSDYTGKTLSQDGAYSPELMARLRERTTADTNRSFAKTAPGVFGGSINTRNNADVLSKRLLDLDTQNATLGLQQKDAAANRAVSATGQKFGDYTRYANLEDTRYWQPREFGYGVASNARADQAAALAGKTNFWAQIANAGANMAGGMRR